MKNCKFLLFVLLFMLQCCNREKGLGYYDMDEFATLEQFDIDNFWRHQEEYNFFFIREDSVFVEQFGNGNYYLEKRYYANEKICICDDLVFYPSGEIKRKKRFISSFPDWTQVSSEIKGLNFPIGKEYNFNHDGEIMEIIDYDTSYKYTLEDMFLFIQNHQMVQPYLNRTADNLKEPYWEVLSELSANTRIYNKIHLHGNTGEIIHDTTFLNPW